MGTNVAPILTNIYMAMLENELKIKCCSDPKFIWPVLFKRFIDDGFGITKGLRKDVEYWIEQFNGLRKTVQIDKYNWGNALDYMDLFVYKGNTFYVDGKFSVSIHQKDTNKFMYIPYRSFHQKHSIKNYVWGELMRYVRYNTEEKNFKKLKTQFFLRLRNRGFKKYLLLKLFSKITYAQRNELLNKEKLISNNCEPVTYQEAERRLLREGELLFAQSQGDEETIVPLTSHLATPSRARVGNKNLMGSTEVTTEGTKLRSGITSLEGWNSACSHSSLGFSF